MAVNKKVSNFKTLLVRLPFDHYKYVKDQSFNRDMSMTQFITGLIGQHKKLLKKSLTKSDIDI